MEELRLGLIKMKDLAAWFQVSPGSFSNNKAKKLEELKRYCKFEDMGRKGINILEIYEAYYQTVTQCVPINCLRSFAGFRNSSTKIHKKNLKKILFFNFSS